MADNDQQFQERTEQATPKRLEEARQRGQIPRSRELSMATVMISAAASFYALQPVFGQQLADLMRSSLRIDPALLADERSMSQSLGQAALSTLAAFAPWLLTVSIAAVLGAVAIGGWAFSAKPLEPKFSKLDPLKGLKRVFGLKGLIEVIKALAKAGVIGGVAIGFLALSSKQLFQLSLEPLRTTMTDSGQLVSSMLLICSLALLLIALIDVPYQLWNYQKELRMTRKDVQDEMKETEGRPEVRQRVRAMQQELASKRMLEDVPSADVVITNPAHFAVALKYSEGDMSAPRVLAKGVDHLAARIREIAVENKVAIFEAPPLARALYWSVEIGQEIPQQLYLAVAQVLTYVYRLKAAAENRGDWPERPVVQVDEALTRNPRGRRRSN